MKSLTIGQKVKNQYGEMLTVKSINDNIVYCVGLDTASTGLYHITKIF